MIRAIVTSFLCIFSEVLVDIDSLVALLVMESAPLFDIDGNQSCQGHHQHGDESGKLSQDNGEADKTHKRNTDGGCCERQKTTSNAHKFQRFLQAFENGITFLIHRHNSGYFIDSSFYLKNSGNASDRAINAIHPPMVSMIVFFTSWSPFCRLGSERLTTLLPQVSPNLPPNRTYMSPCIRLSVIECTLFLMVFLFYLGIATFAYCDSFTI
ncbi:hypothetical protein EVA_04200 [gut metagenome]|uniref:Uncharacterized protein n=1 Tax=gut metagenome TaxID=749906 RepID=J9D4S4_9ZZZZ